MARKIKEADFSKMTKTQTQKILRVNDNNPAHALKMKGDKANIDVRAKDWKPQSRDPNAALPPAQDLWERGIYDGAELRPFEGRPGSMDFKKCPSKGLG